MGSRTRERETQLPGEKLELAPAFQNARKFRNQSPERDAKKWIPVFRKKSRSNLLESITLYVFRPVLAEHIVIYRGDAQPHRFPVLARSLHAKLRQLCAKERWPCLALA
ncbi:MAG: hypothetical protein EPN75_05295 [Beijerinckiaceae bacterium]|nr:MAG: hypothetical protein EPN75_05295 [Beijerinckiaceae bacterium]